MSHAGFNIVPSDTNLLPGVTVGGIYVGGAGNIAAIPASGGAAVTFTAVPAGTTIPLVCRQILATGTTATNIVGFPTGHGR